MPRKKTNRNTAQLLAVLAILIFGAAAAFALSQVMISRDSRETDADGPRPFAVQVDTVHIAVMESFPVQVRVVARGYLPDSCTEIDRSTQTRSGSTFTILLSATRPSDVFCAQVLKPFEENITLHIAGLLKGIYTVDVDGIKETFILNVDNTLPPETGTSTSST